MAKVKKNSKDTFGGICTDLHFASRVRYGIAKLQKMFPAFPKTTVNRQMKKPTGHILIGKKKSNPGAPKRLKKP